MTLEDLLVNHVNLDRLAGVELDLDVEEEVYLVATLVQVKDKKAAGVVRLEATMKALLDSGVLIEAAVRSEIAVVSELMGALVEVEDRYSEVVAEEALEYSEAVAEEALEYSETMALMKELAVPELFSVEYSGTVH